MDTPSTKPDSPAQPDIILPAPIARLEELARNLWWSWSPESRQLFRSISVKHWRSTDHNPVRLLREVSAERLDQISRDAEFLRSYSKVLHLFDSYMTRELRPGPKIAYFSAEYGVHGSLPIYSGGLGILAGDICKTASDLGLDFTAFGFMYPKGYFQQEIASDGDQVAEYIDLSVPDAAIERAFLPSGEALSIAIPFESPTDLLHLQVWLVRCGRVKIYLMDSNVDENQPWNRDITTRLYGGDREYRLRQEIALGIGGVKVVRALGLEPDIWHANEGHVAFMFLERLREAQARSAKAGGTQAGSAAPSDIEEAKFFVRKSSVFTTHTPVPAGQDEFDMDLISRYFWYYWPELGLDKEQFFALGQAESDRNDFNMTALSMNLSARVNAVSKKHLEVTAKMWPELRTVNSGKQDPPSMHPAYLTSVTNGVHVGTWLAPEFEVMFTNEIGTDWREHLTDIEYWVKARNISDERLWQALNRLKTSMFSAISDLGRRKWMEDGYNPTELVPSGMLLDPSVLTIGFARRFATYKRGTLIFNDIERLKKLLNDPLRPIQIIFSGKAHPADEGGKQLIRDIWRMALDPAFGARIAFIENYGMHIAKYLVHGVDVWMNNPKAPLEASGTSGMKAAINGVPNFSILDGWWIEGFQKGNGWGLDGATTGSQEEQDRADAAKMYDTLEKEIIPLYYDKGIDGIPRGWLKVAKESIATIIPRFSSERMVEEYIEKMYK